MTFTTRLIFIVCVASHISSCRTMFEVRGRCAIGKETDDRVEVLMNRFEDIMIEMKSVDLVNSSEYAVSLQFVDRLKRSGKMNSSEKLTLTDVIETID